MIHALVDARSLSIKSKLIEGQALDGKSAEDMSEDIEHAQTASSDSIKDERTPEYSHLNPKHSKADQ